MTASSAARAAGAARTQGTVTHRGLQRKCSCGGSAGLTGQCSDCERKKSLSLQTRPAVGAADDAYEREAEAIAHRVLAGAGPAVRGATAPHIQAYAPTPAEPAAEAPASVTAALTQGGQPMPAPLRDEMERFFAHDFSRVRVHTAGPHAQQSTVELGAQAYTVGHDIVFAPGRFAPSTSQGLHLLAHELTHVVQQSGGGPAAGRLQRGGKDPKTKPESCSGWTCAAFGDCEKPDNKPAPGTEASTSWTLTANLDLDVPKAESITTMREVGHAFVAFSESNGDRYSYGHYPGPLGLPTDFKLEVPGCSVHPDTTHAACVDMQVQYSLSQPEYTKALDFAKSWCKGAPGYHLTDRNCATFVEMVVAAAGKTIPRSRGKVAHGAKTADNPNTLFDAHLNQSDSAIWRARVKGSFTGQYDAGGAVVPFLEFKLNTDDKLAVAGRYSYTGSTGHKVEGSLNGRMIFDIDGPTKAVSARVEFGWTEPGGTGRGVWKVDATGKLKGSWGRGSADSGAGGWELTKTQ